MASDGNWYPPEAQPGTPPPGPVASAPGSTDPKTPWWRRWWAIAIALLLVLIVLARVFLFGDESDTAVDGDGTTTGCSYLGVDDFGDMQVEIRFVNTVVSEGDLLVSVGLFDAGGTRLSTSDELVELARPGETFRIDHDTVEALPSGMTDGAGISCEILGLEAIQFGEAPQPPGDEAACAFVEVDGFGDIQVELSFASPFDEPADLLATYALRGADGVRFKTNSSVTELVSVGEAIRVREDTFTKFPAWVTAEDFTCDILGFNDLGP